MTVQELIDQLSNIDDKNREVFFNVEGAQFHCDVVPVTDVSTDYPPEDSVVLHCRDYDNRSYD